jgi:hypothetical protein
MLKHLSTISPLSEKFHGLNSLQIPLFDDLKAQKDSLRRFLIKSCLFLIVFVLFDQVTGGFLLMGLDRYFGLDISARILCIGHSQSVLGIDKIELEKELHASVAKYTWQGADASIRLAMIRQYLAVHPDSVSIIVYDVNAYSFTGKGLSANAHRLLYPFMTNPVIRNYLKKHSTSPGEYWLRRYLKLPRFNEVTLSLSIRGWLKSWSNLKHTQINIERMKKQLSQGNFRKISFDPIPLKLFRETIDFARAHHVQIVLAYIPTVDLLNEAEPLKYKEAIRIFKEYASKDSGITFFNFNPEFSQRHELFYDPIHLNALGQKIFTEYLAEKLKSIDGIRRSLNKEVAIANGH